jgi:hypothetical protein
VGRVFRVTDRLEFVIVGVSDRIISTGLAPLGRVKEYGRGVSRRRVEISSK